MTIFDSYTEAAAATVIPETVRETLHAETYRGRKIAIVQATTESYLQHGYRGTFRDGSTYTSDAHEVGRRVWVETSIDGRGFRAPTGTTEQLAKKLRGMVDRQLADDEIRARLLGLVANARTVEGFRSPESLDELPVGAVAWVYAMGHRRQGVVTKHGKTRVEVAYTTASSDGRIFRKSVDAGKAWIAA